MKQIKKYLPLLWLAVLFYSPSILSKSEDMGKVIAYPNPFNPLKGNLTIKVPKYDNPPGQCSTVGKIEYIVYTYDQKKIFSGIASSNCFNWSGYTSKGNRVPSGLYFIKILVTLSDSTSSTKIVKIIVQ